MRFLGWLLACWLLASPAQSAERWQLLLLGQTDGTLDDYPLIYEAAEQAILTELKARDIDAFHPELVGVKLGCGAPVCPGLTESDLIQAAKAAERPIDMLVLYSVQVTDRLDPAGTKFNVDIPVTLINLENGEHFFTWDRAAEMFTLSSVKVTSPEFKHWLAGQAEDAGGQSAMALASALSEQARRFVFWLELQRIPVGQAERFYEGLRGIEGGVRGGLTLLEEGNTERQLLHRLTNVSYSYRSELDGGSLRAEVTRLMDEIGIDADVSYDRSGRSLTLTQVGLAYQTIYILGLVLLVLCLYGVYVLTAQRAVQRNLARAAANRQLHAGLATLGAVPAILPRRGAWHALRTQWEAAGDEVLAACSSARDQLDAGDSQRAVETLQLAKENYADHPELLRLLEEARLAVQGDALLDAAQGKLESDPAEAIHLLDRATSLNPRLQPKANTFATRASRVLREHILGGAEVQAQQARAAGDPYAALAALDTALEELRGLSEFVDDRARLLDFREQVIASMPVIRQSCSGQGAFEDTEFLLETPVQSGRSSAPIAGAIGLGYRRLSRLGKQISFDRHSDGLSVSHGASKNGVFVDEAVLKPGARASLTDGTVVAMGGESNPPRKGNCQIQVSMPENSRGSAVLRLNSAPLSLLSDKALMESWPTAHQDLARTWVLLGTRLHAAVDEDGALTFDVGSNVQLLELSMVDGVMYLSSLDKSVPLFANDVQCVSAVPATNGSRFRIGDASFSFHTVAEAQEVTQ